MRTIYFCLTSFILFTTIQVFAQDTLYYDKDWNETTRVNHLYYRLVPLKEMQDIYYIQDFHKNGNMQMQGYILKNNPEQYVGDVYWYDENGYDNGRSQYLNQTADKVLTYYHDDKSLWQKISYNDEGKKEEIKVYLNNNEIGSVKIQDDFRFVGNFSHHKMETYYTPLQHESSVVETDTLTASDWVDSPPYIVSPQNAENQKKEKYYITTFWKNGRKATEEEWIYQNEYNVEKGLVSFWDESGKLLSQVNYTDENYYNIPHTKFTYYTKNGIANSLATQESYIGLYLDGESISFAIDGDASQKLHYTSGALTKEEIFEKDKLVKTNLYLDGEPFDGSFKINQGTFVHEFTMQQGKKIGQESWKNLENGTYFSKGEYKNHKPWSGTFAIEDNLDYMITLHNYKDGVLEGTQKKFLFVSSLEPLETYEMKGGIREGVKKTYLGGDEVIQSIYKNDKIWEGQILDGNDLLTYQNGILIHKKIGNVLTEETIGDEVFYNKKNGNLEKVIYRSFSIQENPQQYYEGIYKSGKPYHGYFQNETLIDNIKLIDYYENGELKYKYSFDFLQQLENYNSYNYNIKSTYTDNKIVEGPTYLLVGNSIMLETLYKNSKPVQFKMNLFGMHYFNQYAFSLEKDMIKITELNSPTRLDISKDGDNFIASLFTNDTLINSSAKIIDAKVGDPNTLVFYYLKENKIHSYSRNATSIDMDSYSMVNQLFRIFPLFTEDTINMLFNKLLVSYQQEGTQEEYFYKAFEEYAPFPSQSFLSFVQYDEHGKIPFGIRISQKNDQILVEGIYENEIKKTLTFTNIAELLKDDKDELKRLESELLNDY